MPDRAQDTEAIRAALGHYKRLAENIYGWTATVVDERRADEADAALDRLGARLEAAEQALAFYANEHNWTQVTSWGGRIHDDESNAITDGGKIARAALAAAAPGETTSTCICTRFSDLPDGTIIADLTCPVHGVNGTDPGDVLPAEYAVPGETEQTP